MYALHTQNSELYQACIRNDVEQAQELIGKGADPTWKHPSFVRLRGPSIHVLLLIITAIIF